MSSFFSVNLASLTLSPEFSCSQPQGLSRLSSNLILSLLQTWLLLWETGVWFCSSVCKLCAVHRSWAFKTLSQTQGTLIRTVAHFFSPTELWGAWSRCCLLHGAWILRKSLPPWNPICEHKPILLAAGQLLRPLNYFHFPSGLDLNQWHRGKKLAIPLQIPWNFCFTSCPYW